MLSITYASALMFLLPLTRLFFLCLSFSSPSPPRAIPIREPKTVKPTKSFASAERVKLLPPRRTRQGIEHNVFIGRALLHEQAKRNGEMGAHDVTLRMI